jgi:hypothetical protein
MLDAGDSAYSPIHLLTIFRFLLAPSGIAPSAPLRVAATMWRLLYWHARRGAPYENGPKVFPPTAKSGAFETLFFDVFGVTARKKRERLLDFRTCASRSKIPKVTDPLAGANGER